MFRRDRIRDAVFDSVDEWRGFLPQRVVGIGLEDDTIVIDLVSEIEPPARRALANSLASRLGEDIQMRLRWVEFEEHDVTGQFRGKTREIRRFRPRTFEEIY
jgi:hypothetical protein